MCNLSELYCALYVVQIALLYKHAMAYELAPITKVKRPSFTPTPEVGVIYPMWFKVCQGVMLVRLTLSRAGTTCGK